MTGSPLPRASCAGCGAAATAASGTCLQCGTPLQPAQRRIVTVLFADLAGYTTLCQSRDPEEVHLLVRPVMNALRRVCEDAGGVVPSIEGDGFMAAFGAQQAREDDPARALSAAVRMQRLVASRQEVLPDLPGLHVGLHVGEVLVAPTWEEVGFSLSGDVVNVASRLAGEAAAGAVLVSDDLALLTGAEQGWGDRYQVSLRGRDAAVPVRSFAWQAVGEVLQSARWTTTSRYVARPGLEDALAAALAEEAGVLVVGEAGSGKSRLVGEALRGRPVVRVSCAGRRAPQARDLVADLLDQLPDAPDQLVLSLRRQEAAAGDDHDEELLLRSAGAVLRDQRPGLTAVLDDAELLPDGEAALLVAAVAVAPTRWVVVSRRPVPGLELTPVQVDALSAEEALAFVDGLLPRASAELRDAVLRRAGDSPLYLEQCVRLLLESGAVTVDTSGSRLVEPARLREIPTSMRLFVSSRLDLLTDAERELLGVAAVLGDVVDPALVHHLVGDAADLLERLVDRGLLRWQDSPLGPPQLSFSHALVRDVAYETQLRSRRAQVHRAAAEWYAILPVAHVLEAQAFHLEAAVALGEADCDLVRRAVEAMVLYARSIEAERTRTAREVLVRAREVAAARPECGVDLLRLQLAWSTVLLLAGDEEQAAAAAAAAVEDAGRRGDAAGEAEGRLLLGRVLVRRGDPAAGSALDAAEALFAAADDLAGLARVSLERGAHSSFAEGVVGWLRQMERAYQLAMRSADTRLQASVAQQLALHHAIASGRPLFEEWASRAREVSRRDDAGLAPVLDLSVAVLASYGLDPAQGLEPARSAVVAARELGVMHTYYNALVIRLDLLVLAGRLADVEALLPEARAVAATRPTDWTDLQVDLAEARARSRGGDAAGAQALLQRVAGHGLADRLVLRRDLAEARAWVALERGHFEEARAHAVQAVLLDEESEERCAPLRPRLVQMVAAVATGQNVPLGDIAALRQAARSTGLPVVAGLADRWLLVDELTRGWSVDLYSLEPLPDVVEARALDLEIAAFQSEDWRLLLQASDEWARLGTTVWEARALLWHTELTGAAHPRAAQLLAALQAPARLAEQLRALVRDLRP